MLLVWCERQEEKEKKKFLSVSFLQRKNNIVLKTAAENSRSSILANLQLFKGSLLNSLWNKCAHCFGIRVISHNNCTFWHGCLSATKALSFKTKLGVLALLSLCA